ncbi:ABC transporter permease [Promineifilum sp.]|uniref:ABC transporter permease n=1 Tax=Promineifilum sp. TaxID=2664178 RepID=UPI0035B0C65F
MVWRLTQGGRAYTAMAAMMPKLFLAYQFQIWFNVVIDFIALAITVAFWQAVFAGRSEVGGLTATQTLNYVMMARIFHDGVYQTNMLRSMGELVRDGGILTTLLRPLDFQGAMYLQNLVHLGLNVMMKAPLAIFAWLVFDLRLPGDPLVWLAFVVTQLLGHAVMFCFDWIVACAVFYTTDAWGLATARAGIATFFSGMLIPLAMMPAWLRTIAAVLPFSQAVYLPISVLSGLTPLSALPRLWLMQLAYLAVLLVLSRLAFSRAVRVVTVQGG